MLLTCSLLAACATTYEPRRSMRVAMVMEAGAPVLVKNGERYLVGAFSGGLVDAVSPNPEAMEHAEAYYQRNTVGLVTSLVGLAILVASPALLLTVDRNDGPGDDRVPVGTLTTALVGLAAYAGGLGIILTAPPHLYDAVNIYNDGVDAAGAVTATGTGR